MDLIANFYTPCLNQFCWDLKIPGGFLPFQFFNIHLNLKDTRFKQQWFCCMYFCLPYITNPMYSEQLRQMVPPPNQNNVAVCNQLTLLILKYISSKLVTLKSPMTLYKSPIFFILLLVSSSSILGSRYFFFLFLKCSLPSSLTLFRLSILPSLGSCNH